jgi:hypothetical protein
MNSVFINGNNNSIVVNRPYIDDSLFFDKRFNEIQFEDSRMICSGVKRTELLNEKLERLMYYSNKFDKQPTIRIYGYFTSFASIRQMSETSDIAKLELLEKTNLIKMAKSNYYIKAIVALDFNKICKLGYSEEQCVARCEDLYYTIRDLDKYENVEVVFDTMVTLNSFWIVDSLLKAEAFNANIDPELLNYSATQFDSNLKSIQLSAEMFDLRFEELKRNHSWRINEELGQSEYVKRITRERLTSYFNGGNLK